MAAKKTKPPAKKDVSSYTSVYLDQETRDALTALAKAAGTSRSQVVTGLIRRAAADDDGVRITELVGELSKLVGAR